jgi:hypothetical protein
LLTDCDDAARMRGFFEHDEFVAAFCHRRWDARCEARWTCRDFSGSRLPGERRGEYKKSDNGSDEG